MNLRIANKHLDRLLLVIFPPTPGAGSVSAHPLSARDQTVWDRAERPWKRRWAREYKRWCAVVRDPSVVTVGLTTTLMPQREADAEATALLVAAGADVRRGRLLWVSDNHGRQTVVWATPGMLRRLRRPSRR